MSIQGAVRIILLCLSLVVLAPLSAGETEEHSWFGVDCYEGPVWRPGFGPISVLCMADDGPEPFPGDADPEPDERSSPECADPLRIAFAHVSQSGAITVVSYELPVCDPPPPAASHDSSESLTGRTAPSPTPKEKAAAGIEPGSGFGVN